MTSKEFGTVAMVLIEKKKHKPRKLSAQKQEDVEEPRSSEDESVVKPADGSNCLEETTENNFDTFICYMLAQDDQQQECEKEVRERREREAKEERERAKAEREERERREKAEREERKRKEKMEKEERLKREREWLVKMEEREEERRKKEFKREEKRLKREEQMVKDREELAERKRLNGGKL